MHCSRLVFSQEKIYEYLIFHPAAHATCGMETMQQLVAWKLFQVFSFRMTEVGVFYKLTNA